MRGRYGAPRVRLSSVARRSDGLVRSRVSHWSIRGFLTAWRPGAAGAVGGVATTPAGGAGVGRCGPRPGIDAHAAVNAASVESAHRLRMRPESKLIAGR